MKIDRYSLRRRYGAVKLKSLLALWLIIPLAGVICGQENKPPNINTETANAPALQSVPQATALLNQVIERVANGPAFSAKVRQRVWTAGREVIGVGIYEQSGGGSGQFNLHVSMHDGDGKHTLQQTSDGRLTWTRSMIADEVSLKRVDVGRLDEWVRAANGTDALSPSLKIGAWAEMLDIIGRDYVLTIGKSHLQSQLVLVISGMLKDESRQRVIQESKLNRWPALYPSHVKVAIAAEDDPETGFGKGLPIRFEFWSLPQDGQSVDADASAGQGRLVTLIELYAIHRIKPPPIDRFRLDTKDAVNFVNETDRYLRQYGIHLTDRQRRQMLR